MSTVVRQRQGMRFRGRSYMAYVLTPEAPVFEWLIELDTWLSRSPGFFAGRPVVLDLSGLQLSSAGIAHLITSLDERHIRVLGIEGVDPGCLTPKLPPLVTGGRDASVPEPRTGTAKPGAAKPAPEAEKPAPKLNSLLIETPVRSGQSVVFPEGDVTILGSVGSGAEIVAGGSIHVYGTLRGRAMAGVTGNAKARIFCHRIEAELLAIDGYYRTADEIDAKLRSQPTQAWLEGSAMLITALN